MTMTKDIKYNSNSIGYRTGISHIINNYADAVDTFLKRQSEHARLEAKAAKYALFAKHCGKGELFRWSGYSEWARREADELKAELAEAAHELIDAAKTMQAYGLPVAENIISMAEAAIR